MEWILVANSHLHGMPIDMLTDFHYKNYSLRLSVIGFFTPTWIFNLSFSLSLSFMAFFY